MTHDDRRPIQLADDALVVLDDVVHCKSGHELGLAAQLIDVDVHSWPRARHHAVTAVGVTLDPVFPAERRHPQAVDQDHGVGGVGVLVAGRHEDLLGLWGLFWLNRVWMTLSENSIWRMAA